MSKYWCHHYFDHHQRNPPVALNSGFRWDCQRNVLMCNKLQHSTSQSDTGKTRGQAIAVRRKALALSQNDLAGMIEGDAETISRFERGHGA